MMFSPQRFITFSELVSRLGLRKIKECVSCIMAIRQLTKAEVNRLLLTLTLAGYIPERDFKIDENGQILARKEIMPVIRRIPALSESDDRLLNDRAFPAPPSFSTPCSS